jgi:hypothetical protein
VLNDPYGGGAERFPCNIGRVPRVQVGEELDKIKKIPLLHINFKEFVFPQMA